MRIQRCGVLLTGASGGIGRAIALELARRNCRIALVARRKEPLAELAREVVAEGGQALAVPVDVGDSRALEAAVAEAAPFLENWRAVIANAGVGYHGPALGGAGEEAMRVLQVNFLGVVNTLQVTSSHLRRPGALGVVSSLSGLIPYRGGAIYAASKAGINAFLRCLRLEVVKDGLTVGWLCPGAVDTPLIVEGVPYEKLPPLAKMLVPVLSPETVAKSLLRLLERGGGQRVIPWQAAFFASFYRHFPKVAEVVLSLTGAGAI